MLKARVDMQNYVFPSTEMPLSKKFSQIPENNNTLKFYKFLK
jgi:hypothetical protein